MSKNFTMSNANSMAKNSTMSNANAMAKNSTMCKTKSMSKGNTMSNESRMSNSMYNGASNKSRMCNSMMGNSMMGNWVSNSVAIGRNTVISHISNISIIVIGMVVDSLDAAIGKIDRVRALDNTGTIIGL